VPVLGLESSCDETAAAIAEDGLVLAERVRGQLDLHRLYGGVVPEIASRAHLEAVDELTREVLAEAGLNLRDLTGLAVTQGPGLVGALLVAINFAKGLALAASLPIAGVNHVNAHALSPFLRDKESQGDPPVFPYVALVASGGHTSLFLVEDFERLTLLGKTLDDAAGEAFDKFAKLLGLGYPGGAQVEALAKRGRPTAYKLARPMLRDGLNFSFSGLKTQAATLYKELNLAAAPLTSPELADLAASFQAAITEVLTTKLLAALKQTRAKGAVVAGGVACNGALRLSAEMALKSVGLPLWVPKPAWSSDNGAMIAFLGEKQLAGGRNLLDLSAEAKPRWPIDHDRD
jgi:N6-L-threonylcarbamoyladenine synthase